MAAGALAPCVARAPAAMVLTQYFPRTISVEVPEGFFLFLFFFGNGSYALAISQACVIRYKVRYRHSATVFSKMLAMGIRHSRDSPSGRDLGCIF